MKRIISFLAMLLLAAAAFAVPTVEAVQAEINRGNYAQAEGMLREVVSAKPNSAKAHYIYAEVLAHNGRFGQAAQETQLAKQIDPELHFTQPDKFRAFERLLDEEQARAQKAGHAVQPAAPAAERHSSGVPGWAWGAGFAVLAVLVWRLFAARSAASSAPTMAPSTGWSNGSGAMPMNGGPVGPYGGGLYGRPPAPGGSGMLGTGIAAAGGFAAGMLAEKLFEGHHQADPGAGLGGLVPGSFDDAGSDPAAQELERRSIDFGSGNDWSDGGSGDVGGGSSSDDGGW